MSRPPIEPAEPVSDIELRPEIADNQREMSSHLARIDRQFGDIGPYNRPQWVRETRFLLGQSAEAILEAGRRLIQMKEHEPHGSWMECLDEIGIDPRAAQRLMQAALKFSNASAPTHLNRLNRTKLFELMVMDDEDMEELRDGGTIAGLTLDEIDRMSTRELRDALRNEKKRRKEDREDLENRLADRNRKVDELSMKLDRKNANPPEIRGEAAIQEIEKTARKLASQCTVEMCRDIKKVKDAMDGGYPTNSAREAILAAFHTVMAGLRDAAYEHGFLAHLDGLFPKEIEEPKEPTP